MIHAIAVVLCLIGFTALAAATERQQPCFVGLPLSATANRRLRLLGAIALLAALAWLVGSHGWGLGLVMVSGHTSLAAGIVYGALIVRARRG